LRLKANYLSKTETFKLLEKLKKIRWLSPLIEGKIKNIFKIEVEDVAIYKIHNVILIEKSGLVFPTLVEKYSVGILDYTPYIIVDMGAVHHIVNGADVMRPGVREVYGEFSENDVIIVKDEKNKKPIAIGRALVDYIHLRSMTKGKVAENIHYIDDKLWRLIHQLRDIIER